MALEQDGIEVAPEAHRHQLHAAQVLGGPGERRDVIVMDGMDPSVQVRVFVVHHVPEEVLGVEDEQNTNPLENSSHTVGATAGSGGAGINTLVINTAGRTNTR